MRPGALHGGRLYHVHHKRLYATIGEPNNRNRRTAPIGALAARLMLLDLLLDAPSRLSLGTWREKRLYFNELNTEWHPDDAELPHLPYGTGRRKVLRLFPAKFAAGAMREDTDTHVITYLVTRRNPVDARALLQRHHSLLSFGGPRTPRLALPRPHHGVEGLTAAWSAMNCSTPMQLSTMQELEWYCAERLRRESDDRFCSPRCATPYRQYRLRGIAALSGVVSRVLVDMLHRKEVRVEFVPLKRQYLHLAPLVRVA